MSHTVLVTGGSGFIGQHLVRNLLQRGARVRVLDVAPISEDLGRDVDFRQGSILDVPTVHAALKGVDRLYHLAANPSLWARNRREFLVTNLQGTRTVLTEAARFDLDRIVYTSTESILKSVRRRYQRDDTPTDESIALTLADMAGPYCRSKFLAEKEALSAAHRGLPVVIVNPTLPVGPGDGHLTHPTKMLLDFVNGSTPGYLECEINMIDVRDVALGHILAADCGSVGERYILGNANLRMSEIISMLGDITGLPMPRLRVPYPVAWASAVISEGLARITARPPTVPMTGVRLARTPMAFDCRKSVAILGLTHSPIRQALEDTVTWFDIRGLLCRPIKPKK